jgi:hypothetical protein
MRAEDKKSLVAAKLGQLMRLSNTDEFLARSTYFDELATSIMDRGLWDTIAPMIDGLAVRTAVENTLRRCQGMPLSQSVIDEVMDGVDVVIDALSDGHAVVVKRGMSHRSSTRLWGAGDERDGGTRQRDEVRQRDEGYNNGGTVV